MDCKGSGRFLSYGQYLSNVGESLRLPLLVHDSTQQRCRLKQVYVKPHVCGNTRVLSPSNNLLIYLNTALLVNLLKVSSGISFHFSDVSANEEFQPNHMSKLLEKVFSTFLPNTICFFLMSLRNKDATGFL